MKKILVSLLWLGIVGQAGAAENLSKPDTAAIVQRDDNGKVITIQVNLPNKDNKGINRATEALNNNSGKAQAIAAPPEISFTNFDDLVGENLNMVLVGSFPVRLTSYTYGNSPSNWKAATAEFAYLGVGSALEVSDNTAGAMAGQLVGHESAITFNAADYGFSVINDLSLSMKLAHKGGVAGDMLSFTQFSCEIGGAGLNVTQPIGQTNWFAQLSGSIAFDTGVLASEYLDLSVTKLGDSVTMVANGQVRTTALNPGSNLSSALVCYVVRRDRYSYSGAQIEPSILFDNMSIQVSGQ